MATVKLGPLTLSSDLLLAPMMDITTPSYVKTINHYGGLGLYSMPMVFINQIAQAPKTIRPILEFAEQNTPSSVQICGSGKSYEVIKEALDVLNSYNFSIIDINSGCPARHTCNSGGGASLMKPHRFNDLQHLVQSTIKLSNKPVSVKIRTGWDSKDSMEQIIRMIEDEGAAFLTIHGRLARQGYSGTVDIESITRAKQLSNIPVVGNGDVFNYETYNLMKNITHVDAIMIGRAAMGFPETFKDISNQNADPLDSNDLVSRFYEELKTDRNPNSPEKIQEYLRILLDSIEHLGKYYNNENFKLTELRRNAIWMLKGSYNCAKIREKIGKTKKITELIDYLFSSQFITDLTKINTVLSE
ncbi:MAG: tRNA-dihydrouridine synthase family protein [Promethearchaeota archaeon]|nr:MAG: tRNA-dihydrouridine synthase family protein [Candidatus Lokiarchaeota archaeon]